MVLRPRQHKANSMSYTYESVFKDQAAISPPWRGEVPAGCRAQPSEDGLASAGSCQLAVSTGAGEVALESCRWMPRSKSGDGHFSRNRLLVNTFLHLVWAKSSGICADATSLPAQNLWKTGAGETPPDASTVGLVDLCQGDLAPRDEGGCTLSERAAMAL